MLYARLMWAAASRRRGGRPHGAEAVGGIGQARRGTITSTRHGNPDDSRLLKVLSNWNAILRLPCREPETVPRRTGGCGRITADCSHSRRAAALRARCGVRRIPALQPGGTCHVARQRLPAPRGPAGDCVKWGGRAARRLLLLLLTVMGWAAFVGGDIFDDAYRDCPAATRLRDGQIADLTVTRDADDEDTVNVAWAATDPATWGLGGNAFRTSLVLLLDGGGEDLQPAHAASGPGQAHGRLRGREDRYRGHPADGAGDAHARRQLPDQRHPGGRLPPEPEPARLQRTRPPRPRPGLHAGSHRACLRAARAHSPVHLRSYPGHGLLHRLRRGLLQLQAGPGPSLQHPSGHAPPAHRPGARRRGQPGAGGCRLRGIPHPHCRRQRNPRGRRRGHPEQRRPRLPDRDDLRLQRPLRRDRAAAGLLPSRER